MNDKLRMIEKLCNCEITHCIKFLIVDIDEKDLTKLFHFFYKSSIKNITRSDSWRIHFIYPL